MILSMTSVALNTVDHVNLEEEEIETLACVAYV